jgi:hypothetical protein
MFIATALSPRGENNILSSSPQEAAHLKRRIYCKNCKQAFAGDREWNRRGTRGIKICLAARH